MNGLFVACYASGLLLGTAALDQRPEFVVELTSPRRDYLWGEPVILDLVARNTGPQAITAYNRPAREIELNFAREDRGFEKFERGGAIHKEEGRGYEVLKPNEERKYRIRVFTRLVDIEGAGLARARAFLNPGRYTIKAAYALMLEGAPTHQRIESNPIQIQIALPEGKDAEVSLRLGSQEMLEFLETGTVQDRLDPEHRIEHRSVTAAKQVIALLRAAPQTGYREALAYAMREFYQRVYQRRGLERLAPRGLTLDEDMWLRQFLGIKELGADFFSADKRLDVQVIREFEGFTPIDQVLASYTAQSKVPLTASPMFQYQFQSSAREVVDLRSAMRQLSQSHGPGYWTRRGAGYYLYGETLLEADARQVVRAQLEVEKTFKALLFTADKRLAAEVVLDYPEPTPVSEVLRSFASQSKVPLSAAPLFETCLLRSERRTADLRGEMAFLARTFAATWERRGDGYFLAVYDR